MWTHNTLILIQLHRRCRCATMIYYLLGSGSIRRLFQPKLGQYYSHWKAGQSPRIQRPKLMQHGWIRHRHWLPRRRPWSTPRLRMCATRWILLSVHRRIQLLLASPICFSWFRFCQQAILRRECLRSHQSQMRSWPSEEGRITRARLLHHSWLHQPLSWLAYLNWLI